jgi:hypothetical protein
MSKLLKIVIALVSALVVVGVLYGVAIWHWSYSDGERAGWVQKLSRKGWLCKTWEGELAMVSMPGAIPEKFLFTIHNDAVAEQVNRAMGRRVSLHYEEKVGLPTSCFGDTRYFVTGVRVTDDAVLPPLSPAAGQPVASGASVPR